MFALENLKRQSSIQELSRETINEGRFVRKERIVYKKGTDPKEHEYESVQRIRPEKGIVVEVKNIVASLVVTEDEKVILINQYRIPIGGFCIENPAGLCDIDNETKEEAAMREILEETGYVPEELIYIGKTPTSAGLSTEIIDLYIGVNAKKVNDILTLDNAEDIQVLEIPLGEVDEFLKKVEENTEILVDFKVKYLLSEYRKIRGNGLRRLFYSIKRFFIKII